MGLWRQLATTQWRMAISNPSLASDTSRSVTSSWQMKLRVLMRKGVMAGTSCCRENRRHRRGKAQRSAQRAALIVAGAGKNLADLPKRFV